MKRGSDQVEAVVKRLSSCLGIDYVAPPHHMEWAQRDNFARLRENQNIASRMGGADHKQPRRIITPLEQLDRLSRFNPTVIRTARDSWKSITEDTDYEERAATSRGGHTAAPPASSAPRHCRWRHGGAPARPAEETLLALHNPNNNPNNGLHSSRSWLTAPRERPSYDPDKYSCHSTTVTSRSSPGASAAVSRRSEILARRGLPQLLHSTRMTMQMELQCVEQEYSAWPRCPTKERRVERRQRRSGASFSSLGKTLLPHVKSIETRSPPKPSPQICESLARRNSAIKPVPTTFH